MVNYPYVFDASTDNFQRLVLENSAKGPVLVNYWSPKAGRAGLHALFELLDEDDERVVRYRSRLQAAMH